MPTGSTSKSTTNPSYCLSAVVVAVAAAAAATSVTTGVDASSWIPQDGGIGSKRTRSGVAFKTFCERRPRDAAEARRPPPLLEKNLARKQPQKQRQLERRTCRTPYDTYYKTHGKLPLPSVMHAALPLPKDGNEDKEERDASDRRRKAGILIIGDVHGCYDEMLELHDKALAEYNNIVCDDVKNDGDGKPIITSFRYVVLVGDLGNKGPSSARVVRYVRQTDGWYAVRGNHDDGALLAALGDEKRRNKLKYRWVLEGEQRGCVGERSPTESLDINAAGEDEDVVLSDNDVAWMAELPYTIRIPRGLLAADGDEKRSSISADNLLAEADTLVVHAGLIPGVELQDQTIKTMITLRNVDVSSNENSGDNSDEGHKVPWAAAWEGPERVIFGHDARRGLQSYRWAMGLDTGCCYGKKLTGIVLPPRKIVQVEAREAYCPVGGNEATD